MTEPKDPEQKPDQGSTPTPGAYISPKLREKLMAAGDTDDEWTPKPGSPIPAIIMAVIVIGLGVAGFMWWQSSAKAAKAKADAEAAVVRADSLATVARAESLIAVVRADSLMKAAIADSLEKLHPGRAARLAAEAAKAAAARSGASSAASSSSSAAASAGATPAGGAAAAAATPTTPKVATDGFGIAVGSFMSEDRAKAELDKLAGTTGLTGIVAPTMDGGATVYQVILGKYAKRASADARGAALIDSSLVREARAVPRPK